MPMLESPNQRIEAVYFPETGFASVRAVQRSGKEVEVGLIGSEGMTGLPIALGDHRSPHALYVQAPGKGLRIPASELRQAIHASIPSGFPIEVSFRRSACKQPTPRSATRNAK